MGCLRTSQVHVRARLDAVFFQVLANLNCIVKMTRGQFEVLPFYVLAPPPHTPSHSSKPTLGLRLKKREMYKNERVKKGW